MADRDAEHKEKDVPESEEKRLLEDLEPSDEQAGDVKAGARLQPARRSPLQ